MPVTIEGSEHPFTPPAFSHARAEHLLALERSHFWFGARQTLLGQRLRSLVSPPARLAELGCGTGAFSAHATALGYEVTAVDGHLSLLQAAQARHAAARLVLADLAKPTPLSEHSYDVCCSLDVLEHVDPLPLLHEAHRILKPRGALLISVPAHEWLWGTLDEQAGHRCRYSRSMLRRELNAAGFSIEGYTSYQFLLLPLVWASRRLMRADSESLERRPPATLSRVFAAVNQFEVARLGKFSLPVGSSLIAWARRVQ